MMQYELGECDQSVDQQDTSTSTFFIAKAMK